jgi:hypothetical protein
MFAKKAHPALAVLAILLMVLTACGGGSSRPSAPGGVSGVVVVGYLTMPLTGPVAEGMGGGLLDNEPLPHVTVVVRGTSGASAGKVVAEVRTNDQGSFRVALPRGSYSIYAGKCPQMAETVTVDVAHFTSVRVVGRII